VGEADVFAKLIDYECVASAHRPALEHPDKLTIHDGHWAFCPFDALAEGHEWRETGGEDLAALERRMSVLLARASEAAHTA